MARENHFWGKRVIALIAATCTFGSLTLVPMATAASSADASAQQNGGQSQTDGDAANSNATATAESNGANASDIQTDAPAAPDASGDQSQQAADAATVTSNDGNTVTAYGTFKAALDAAKTGETVTLTANSSESVDVANGSDHEGVTVTAAKGIVYSGTMTVHGAATIIGMTFSLTGKDGSTTSVAVKGAGNVRIEKNTFGIADTADQSQSYNGVRLSDGAAHVTISGNTFAYATRPNSKDVNAVSVQGGGNGGSKVATDITVENNTLNIAGDTDGKGLVIFVSASGNTNDYGITGLKVTGNTVTAEQSAKRNAFGAYVQGVQGLTFTGNTFTNLWQALGSGAATDQNAKSDKITVGGNTFNGTTIGYDFTTIKLGDSVPTFAELDKGSVNHLGIAAGVQGKDGVIKAYPTLGDTVGAAKDGDTIVLLSNVTLDAPLTVSKQITLDGHGYALNGQLKLGGSASGSTIENTYFIQNGRDVFSGGFASSLELSGADDVTIKNNTFTITSDAKISSGRAVAVYVQPSSGEKVVNTTISNNTFDLEDNKDANGYHYAILLTNEVNSGTNPGVLNTIISNNTLKGRASLARTRFLSTYDTAATPRVGVKGVTVTNNTLAAEEGSTTNLLMDFWGGTGDITIQGNTFGAGDMGVLFRAQKFQGNNKQTAPQENVVIKGNTFNSKNAVIDGGGLKQEGGLVAYGDGQTGADANKFGPDTTPFAGTTAEATLFYGVTYRDTDGKLLGWEHVAEKSTVDPGNVPTKAGFTATWYKDKQFKTPFDPAKDTVNGNLTLFPKWTLVSTGGGTTVITKKETTITGVTAQDAWFDGKAHAGFEGTPSSDFKGSYEITYSGSGSTVYGPSKDAPTAAGTYRVTISVPSSDSTWFGSLALEFSIRSGSTVVGRFYAPGQDRHMWTASAAESGVLPGMGWNREGDAFTMDGHVGNPVYRLYDPRGNQHLWTTSVEERDYLVSQHWNDEGIAFYENPTATVDVYRLYNPWTGEHLWTTSVLERDSLTALSNGAWTYEGVAFKALS